METQAAYPGLPDPAEAAAAARRAQVLVYTRCPATPRWLLAATGVWAAVFTASFAAGDWVQIGTCLIHAALVGAFVGYQKKRRGVLVSMSAAPSPIKSAYRWWLLAYGLLVAAVVVVFVAVNWWAASLLAGIALPLATWDHEQRYASAARRAETEAGIAPAVASGKA